MDTFSSNAIIKLRYNKAKLWSIKLHSKRTGKTNLCFQVIYHISNGAILWKPDAMINNLEERMSYGHIYKILQAIQDLGLAAKQTSSFVGW